MPYTRSQVAKLKRFRKEVTSECSEVVLKFAARQYGTAQAKEYATHGFGRRVYILLRCVDRVYSIIRPASTKRPKGERVDDVIINLQAFVFNVFGCLDNLAWVWVLERGVKDKKKQTLLSPAKIGIGPKHREVWDSFPATFRDEIRSFDSWFANLEGFRHALAHRVPLYVPPYTISPADEAEFQRRGQDVERVYAAGDLDAYVEAISELHSIGRFEPMMLHSPGQGSPSVMYHGQVLNDLKTVAHIGARVLEELDQPAAP